MLAFVLGEVRTFREAHAADIANVWFVEQMGPRVALEINQNVTIITIASMACNA